MKTCLKLSMAWYVQGGMKLDFIKLRKWISCRPHWFAIIFRTPLFLFCVLFIRKGGTGLLSWQAQWRCVVLVEGALFMRTLRLDGIWKIRWYKAGQSIKYVFLIIVEQNGMNIENLEQTNPHSMVILLKSKNLRLGTVALLELWNHYLLFLKLVLGYAHLLELVSIVMLWRKWRLLLINCTLS